MKFKLPRLNLLVKILIAIALGIIAGQFFPIWLGRGFATFNAIFNQFLGFLIPLLIVGFVAPAIADVGSNAGKMLVATAALAYLSTIFFGFMSFGVSDTLFPSLISKGALVHVDEGIDLTPYFNIEMKPLMDITSALVLAFVVGLCLAYMKGKVLRQGFDEFREIIAMTIAKVIIPLLPLYIFGIFLSMTVSGQVATVMGAFAKIILIIFAMHIFILLLQYSIAGLVAKKNPFKMLLTMMPAYFTALGTQSSAATIPVTLRQAIKMGVSEDVAGFVIPLCATIHLSGSCMKLVACSVAIMIMEGLPYDTQMFSGFIMMLGITMVAAPGVPGGAIMAALGLLGSILNFSQADQALMIALYIAMDSFGTACNVTGDGFIAVIINKCFPSNATPQPDPLATDPS